MRENNFRELKKRRSFDVNHTMQNLGSEHSSGLIYSINLGNKCYYHPSREALAKCKQCAEPICAKCRFIYRGDVILDIPDEELCFRCYADKTRLNRIFEFVMNCVFIFNFVSFITVLFLLFAYEIWGA